MTLNPYKSLPKRSFWRSAVAERNPLELTDLYQKRFPIGSKRIAAAGSCFAQHIGRQFSTRGFNYIDAEPAPPGLTPAARKDFGYGLFSARFGNIYTARQLLQLVQRAYGEFIPAEDCWKKGDRCIDPFRPTIEPDGFSSEDEMRRMRKAHLAAVRRMLESCDVFVFTLGLTEAWLSNIDGAVFPMCPGTVGGDFNPDCHKFKNFTVAEILADMESFIQKMRKINPEMEFILTVSPVPLTATASHEHVLSATTYSKSVLRAVAGELCQRHDFVDYFPSYELVTAPSMRGIAYEPNARSVASAAVSFVMSHFFSQHEPPVQKKRQEAELKPEEIDIVCDESRLEEAHG